MKAAIVSVGALLAVMATAYGSIFALDARYAPVQLVEDLVWSGMKREIRELRRDVSEGRAAPEDLQELLDRFCRSYPNDRECVN
jgi:hypothetical protein